MAADDPSKVFRLGGKLIKSPTNLAIASPFGGTPMGILDDIVIRPVYMTSPLKGADDKFANQTVEAVECGESWLMGVTLRQWDNDTLTSIFANTVVGTSGNRILQRLSTTPTQPGLRASNRSFSMLLEPNDPVQPHLLMYRVLPLLEETAELNITAIDELYLQVVFHLIPNPTGNLYQMGTLSDLSLTP